MNPNPEKTTEPETQRLPSTVLRFGWIAFFTDVATEMAYPLLPAFLIALGSGAQALGIMEGVAESISAAVKWWSGKESDRARARKPYVVAGYAIATFIRPALALATKPFHVILVRSIDRVGKGVRAAPRDALVAASVPEERRGAAFGFERMMDNLGAVFGPMIAFSLARAGVPLRTIFATTIFPGLIAMAIVIGLREKARDPSEIKPIRDRREPRPRGEDQKIIPISAGVKKYLFVVAIFSLGASADSFLIFRMLDLGLPIALAPIVWLSLNASKSALNIPGGKIADRFGKKKTLVVGWTIYAAAYALFPLTHSVSITWALIVAYGAYYGLAEVGEKALIAELADPASRGRSYGAFHAVTGFVVLPANALFGYLYSAHAALAFGLSSICAFFAAVLLAFV
ncbi:MAG: MFS transporter [Polyangiaceae bacterium]